MSERRVVQFRRFERMCYFAERKNRCRINNISIHPLCKERQLEFDFAGNTEYLYVCPDHRGSFYPGGGINDAA